MKRFDDHIDWQAVNGYLLKRERITDSSASTIKEGLRSSIEKAKRLAKPGSLTLNIPIVNTAGDSIILSGGVSLTGKSMTAYMKNAREVILFLVTIGSDIEETASSLMKNGDGLSGYLMDRIGSFAVESLAECLENHVRKEYAAENLSVSMRYSPGYCDWPLDEQLKLDKLIGYSRIGVRLNESLMMTPKKSISGLIALGDREAFAEKRSQCDMCSTKRCDYRRS